jgi:hypothetical protein
MLWNNVCFDQEPGFVVTLCCEKMSVLVRSWDCRVFMLWNKIYVDQEPGAAADERSAAAEASADGPGSWRTLIWSIYLYAGIGYFKDNIYNMQGNLKISATLVQAPCEKESFSSLIQCLNRCSGSGSSYFFGPPRSGSICTRYGSECSLKK